MIEGKTRSGIGFTLNEQIREDWRFQKLISRLASYKGKTDEASIIAVNRTIESIERLVFGTDEGVEAFESAVADVHGGVCTTDTFSDELGDILSALETKNS